MNKQQVKLFLTLILAALSVYFLYPTFHWYSLSPKEQDRLRLHSSPILGKILNLGLDLQGGVHLLLELDEDKLEADVDANDALNRAIEIIRNRVDQFGVAEPLIVRQGERWIVVQLPGLKDPRQAKALIGKTAMLEFRLVDNTGTMERIIQKSQELNISLDELYDTGSGEAAVIPPQIQSELPAGYTLLPGKEGSFFVVKSTAEVTGAYLVDAKVQLGGGYGLPTVALEFNRDGARLFARATEANVGRNLAIILDGTVQSAPVIRTAIPDGRAVIEGNFTPDDAKLLATILRAGALPAPLRIIEERTVGPTLGEDSIRAGIKASLYGLLFVIFFMIFYYRGAGVIADTALLLNLLFIFGFMAYFHATLTLPGIAGIILTVGMAVDANVLINERIREELRAGKTVRVAIDLGYEKAFSAILDGNLTTLIAAFFLFQFGTGPVKGFAVTLVIGLIASMYTAIVVTRLIINYLLAGRPATAGISI